MAMLALGGASSAFAWQGRGAVGAAALPSAEGLTDRVIVKYKDADLGVSPSPAAWTKARVAGNRQGVQLSHLRRTWQGADVIKLDKRMSLEQARALARDLKAGDATIEYAEPDRILQAQWVPTDAMYAQQWHYFDAVGGINAPAAWDKVTGAGVVVAVLDTGVRPHADLAANLLPGYDFIIDTLVSNDGNGRDADASDPGDATTAGQCYSGSPASNSSWHGTHVAGTIAAVTNNASGVAGVAFGAKVLPVRVLGRCGGYTSDIADAMIWAAGGTVTGVPANPNPAKVINLSLGGAGACDLTSQNAINAARARGATVVVAAGNSNADASQFSPASCAGVVTVAATGKTGGKASYSNFGSVVSLAAPGGDGGSGVISTWNTGTSVPGSDGYAAYLGTSMATPHVSGVAALMLSRNASLSPDQVASILTSTARPFPATCSPCGAGIVNASAAVDAVPAAVTPPVATVAELESNNSTRAAQAIATTPVVINGTVASKTDTDYFKTSVPAGGRLVGTLTPNSSANYNLSAYNASGKLLGSSSQGTGLKDVFTVTNTGTQAATVYWRVIYASGATGAAGNYSLGLNR